METRAADGGRAAGGRAIPTIRAQSAYLVTGVAAAAILAAVGAYATFSAATAGAALAVGAGAGAGLAVFSTGIAVGRLRVTHWATCVVAVLYVASLLTGGGRSDAPAPVVAIGLLASSELASWSIDSRRRGTDDLSAHVQRLRSIGLVIAAALALAALAESASSFSAGGTVLAALATVAVLLGVAALGMLMWRSAAHPR